MIQILKSNGATGGTFTDALFSSSKLTLSIDGGGSLIFNNVSSSTTFNINGSDYSVSGKTINLTSLL